MARRRRGLRRRRHRLHRRRRDQHGRFPRGASTSPPCSTCPVLFVIENNKFAYSTPNASQYRCERLADRAAGLRHRGPGRRRQRRRGPAPTGPRAGGATCARKPRPVLLECDTHAHARARRARRLLLCAAGTAGAVRGSATRSASRASAWSRRGSCDARRARRASRRSATRRWTRRYHQALAEPAPDPATLTGGCLCRCVRSPIWRASGRACAALMREHQDVVRLRRGRRRVRRRVQGDARPAGGVRRGPRLRHADQRVRDPRLGHRHGHAGPAARSWSCSSWTSA